MASSRLVCPRAGRWLPSSSMHWGPRRLMGVVTTCLVLLSWAPLHAAARGRPLACGTWIAVPADNPGDYNHLVSISGASPRTDVWAVGEWSPTGGDADQ